MNFAEDIVARARGDLNRAQRDASSARDKLARAESEISDLEAFLRKLDHYSSPAVTGSTSRTFEHGPRRTRQRVGGKSKALVNVAIDIIRDAGTRVPIVDLFDGILARGLDIGGADEKSNLAGYLSRDPRVDYERNVGWGIVNEGVAPEPASQQATPSIAEGGSNDRPTIDLPGIGGGQPPSTFAGAG